MPWQQLGSREPTPQQDPALYERQVRRQLEGRARCEVSHALDTVLHLAVATSQYNSPTPVGALPSATPLFRALTVPVLSLFL